jgi:hypothetical protein
MPILILIVILVVIFAVIYRAAFVHPKPNGYSRSHYGAVCPSRAHHYAIVESTFGQFGYTEIPSQSPTMEIIDNRRSYNPRHNAKNQHVVIIGDDSIVPTGQVTSEYEQRCQHVLGGPVDDPDEAARRHYANH